MYRTSSLQWDSSSHSRGGAKRRSIRTCARLRRRYRVKLSAITWKYKGYPGESLTFELFPEGQDPRKTDTFRPGKLPDRERFRIGKFYSRLDLYPWKEPHRLPGEGSFIG